MPVQIPVARLKRYANVFGDGFCWSDENGDPKPRVKRKHVEKAIASGRFQRSHIGDDDAARVAYFVVNEDKTPIWIDVGVPHMGCFPEWIITDGNHRFMAAIIAGREFITATVAGDLELAQRMFGVDCSEEEYATGK